MSIYDDGPTASYAREEKQKEYQTLYSAKYSKIITEVLKEVLPDGTNFGSWMGYHLRSDIEQANKIQKLIRERIQKSKEIEESTYGVEGF